MSWKGVTVMDQRIRFISEYLGEYCSITELCRQFEISRKTGYKWIGRYRQFGPQGLGDLSTKPHNCPQRIERNIIDLIISIRQKHPSWGPKKLLARLKKQHPGLSFPAISTTADVLKREGLILPCKRRIRRKHPGCPKTKAEEPNDIRPMKLLIWKRQKIYIQLPVEKCLVELKPTIIQHIMKLEE